MAANISKFGAGETIFRENEKGNHMYILQKGCVEIKKKVDQGTVLLKIVDTVNDFFGEMALVDEKPRSATAIAREETEVLMIDQASFEKLIVTNGKFALKIIKILSERIRNSNVEISELITDAPLERLCKGMTEYAQSSGEKIYSGGIKVNINEMSAWLNNNYGFALQDIESNLSKLIRQRSVNYALTSMETKTDIVLTPTFIQDHQP